MPGGRAQDAVDSVRDALNRLGLLVTEPPDGSSDLLVGNPAGGQLELVVKSVALGSADTLPRQLARWRQQSQTAGILVADRVTRDAREQLLEAGWGWLDLRGHLHLALDGLFVDTTVAPQFRAVGQGRSDPLVGRVAVEVAALLLLDPSRPLGIREAATTLGRAPSSVSQAVAAMRSAGLVDPDRRPAVPELFWELAEHWNAPATPLASMPPPERGAVSQALRLGLQDSKHSIGWALSDTVAAAAYGAPVSIRSDAPPDFYVPDEATLRRAVQLLGSATHPGDRAATVRVAPVPLVCNRRRELPAQTWPIAQPLFVALDLAQDPGRGREILASWTPPGQELRVW